MIKITYKKAAQGVGTLIIFIALILVAAVAAAVLISTAANLQSSSYDVGSQAEERLRGAVEIIRISANDASDGTINGSQDEINLIVRLAAGSNPIKIEDLTVSLDTRSSSSVYSITQGGLPDFTREYFGYLLTDSGFDTQIFGGYLQRGQLMRIEIFPPEDIGERERFTIALLGASIQRTAYDLQTPSAMVEETIRLFP